jgi:DNA-binding MarR family transcriptional regulator
MYQKPSDAVVNAWIALVRAQQAAVLRVERAFREAGLPPHSWYDLLWELDRAESTGLRPFEIERRMLIAQSNISRLIDRLEAKGYVERRACESDGRGQHVAITPAGRDLRKRMWPVYANAISTAVGMHLDDQQATDVALLLAGIANQ